MIIVPLNWNFGTRCAYEQRLFLSELQTKASAEGVQGVIVPVWDNGGQMHFLCPPDWHSFFSHLDLPTIHTYLNRELCW